MFSTSFCQYEEYNLLVLLDREQGNGVSGPQNRRNYEFVAQWPINQQESTMEERVLFFCKRTKVHLN